MNSLLGCISLAIKQLMSVSYEKIISNDDRNYSFQPNRDLKSHVDILKKLWAIVVLDQLTSIFTFNTISASIQLFEGIEGWCVRRA